MTPSPRSAGRGRGEAAGAGVGRDGPEVPWAEKVGMRGATNGPSPADADVDGVSPVGVEALHSALRTRASLGVSRTETRNEGYFTDIAFRLSGGALFALCLLHLHFRPKRGGWGVRIGRGCVFFLDSKGRCPKTVRAAAMRTPRVTTLGLMTLLTEAIT